MDYENWTQTYAPDKQKLAELTILAKGSARTMAQFAADSGVSAPTLSRIGNGKVNGPIAMSTLEKIYAARGPEADYSFEALLLANGMVDQKVVERGKEYAERFTSQKDAGIALERHAKNAIVNALLERGITIQSIHPEYRVSKNEAPYGIALTYDFTLFIPDEQYSEWYFEVVNGPKRSHPGSANIFRQAARVFLLDAWAPEFLANKKISFIFDYKATYEQFIMQYKDAPINSAMSAILVNAESETVIKETWMSASPEPPSIFDREIIGEGEVAVWADEEFDDDDEE